MGLQEIRAAMKVKAGEIRAKINQLDADDLPKARVDALVAEHDALVAEYDDLAEQERQALASTPEPHVHHYGSSARAPGTERQQRREAMTQALLHRSAPAQNELTPQAREFRGCSLIDMAKECLAAEGMLERGMSRPEVAQRSLMSTSDFPLTLANVTNTTLRQSYAAAPRTFLPIATRRDLKNFKPATQVQLGAAPQLLPVLENGEFKRGSMVEGAESMQLRSYGRVVPITRQVILNDDLGAFTDLPKRFGQSAASLESDIVWSLILSNPTLRTDGQPVFCAGHGNVGTGGGSSLTMSAISAGRIAMAKQRDPDGVTVLNVAPKFIVAPTDLEVPTAQLLFGITPATTAAAVPESIRGLIPITEPRLSIGVGAVQGSTTGWYLFADPAVAEVICYGYLEGQDDGRYTETRTGFDVDGFEVKCRHDFAAAAVDYRGGYRAAGA